MSYEDFISKLNPKVAQALKTASETKVEKLETASYGLTRALGGGFVKGRVALVYGANSSGKTALMLQSIGRWQKQGLVCAFFDAERSYDPAWAARLGVNNDELILDGSRSSGRIEEQMRPLLESEIDVIVLDSISDIMPEVFVGKDGVNQQEDRKQIGSQAKAITALLNGIHYLNKNTAVILLSQTTTKITPTHIEQVPHGGQKIGFASTQIVRLNSSPSPSKQINGKIRVGDHLLDEPVAREVDFSVRKNKVGRPFGSGQYRFDYAGDVVGIDELGEIIDAAISYDVVAQSGAWFKFGGEKYHGKQGLVDAIRGTSIVDEIKAKIAEIEE